MTTEGALIQMVAGAAAAGLGMLAGYARGQMRGRDRGWSNAEEAFKLRERDMAIARREGMTLAIDVRPEDARALAEAMLPEIQRAIDNGSLLAHEPGLR